MRSQVSEKSASCPKSRVVVSAPIFALSAESNEIFGVRQSSDNFQIVEQNFCDPEVCRNEHECQQVSIVRNVLSSVDGL